MTLLSTVCSSLVQRAHPAWQAMQSRPAMHPGHAYTVRQELNWRADPVVEYKQAQLGVIVIEDDDGDQMQCAYSCRFNRQHAMASQEEKEHGAADAAGVVVDMVARQTEEWTGLPPDEVLMQDVFALVVRALHRVKQLDPAVVAKLFRERRAAVSQAGVRPSASPRQQQATSTGTPRQVRLHVG